MAARKMSKSKRAVTYRNRQFNYTIEGSGPAIFMVPPPGMGVSVYNKFTSLDDNYTLVKPDFSGWEITICQEDESMLQLYVLLLKKIMEQEGLSSSIFMGYSAGGTIVQAFCIQHMEKVKAVILAGAYPKVATKGLDLQYKLGLYVLHRKPEAVIRFLGSAHARDKSFKRMLENKMMTSNIAGVYKFFAESYYFDCTESLSSFTIPFLTIYGENETWLYKHRRYYDLLPCHMTASIENSLHQHPVRKPQVITHILKVFLKGII